MSHPHSRKKPYTCTRAMLPSDVRNLFTAQTPAHVPGMNSRTIDMCAHRLQGANRHPTGSHRRNNDADLALFVVALLPYLVATRLDGNTMGTTYSFDPFPVHVGLEQPDNYPRCK